MIFSAHSYPVAFARSASGAIIESPDIRRGVDGVCIKLSVLVANDPTVYLLCFGNLAGCVITRDHSSGETGKDSEKRESNLHLE